MKNVYKTLCIGLLLCISFLAVNAQVPRLSSYPSASAVIFLDFDGHLVNGTSWNSSGPIECSGSNLNPAQITEVFNRVAEDYRPFNINVTTDSALYWAAPAGKRTRVILTISSAWYGAAGGVSFTNSFTWFDNTPCFVFTALLNYNVKYISEAASHEAGHTLGLRHQSSYDNECNKTAEYNSGNGSGEIGWAPIMGVGYYRNQTLWHYGTNPYGCNYMQDDLGLITTLLSYRPDDYVNTIAGATNAAFTNNRFSVDGVIETPNDIDVVQFALTGKSNFKLEALPFSIAAGDVGSNLDLQVELVNSEETVVGVYNPVTTLNASIDTVLDAGTYYLRVQGKGNEFAPNYASLGSYTLNAIVSGNTLPVHKLELKATTTENNRHKLDWEIVADENVVSQTVEVSTDGTRFQALSAVDAAVRSFSYLPSKNNLLFYRVNVLFDNGHSCYLNIAILRSNGINSKPYLVTNVVTGDIAVNSPSTYEYTVHDLSGRVMAKGKLAQGLNNITTGFIANGLYIIRYANNEEQYTEKFMKR